MAKTRSMTRKQNHDGEASSSKRSKTCAPWLDLNHDVLLLVMMQLGFGDYYSFRGVCKSWRQLAHCNIKKFMASRPPMSVTISNDADENVCCYLEDFEGRKFKTILPSFAGGDCIGVTCGYLIFFTKETRDFWLVNPITWDQLYFPDLPIEYHDPGVILSRAILVFSTSISGWVFVVFRRYSLEMWFCIEGKGAWTRVSQSVFIADLYAFKGKLYASTYNRVHEYYGLGELRLNPQPKLTILEIKKPDSFSPYTFVGSGENLFVSGVDQNNRNSLREVFVGERKWVKPCEKSLMKEYGLFYSESNCAFVAAKRESWADPQSRSHGRYADTHNNKFIEKMWYFPHQCMNVDCIDE